VNLADNTRRIADLALKRAGDRQRFILALAGPPGVGKSTLSDALINEFDQRGQSAAVVPMDGFHFDNAVLDARGDRSRKGAPFTFDADGFAALMRRLGNEPDRDIAIPVFDRALDLSRACGRIIGPGHRFVIAEGNYLLLDQPPWRDMAGVFDMTVMLTASPEVLSQRLIQRWLDHGLSEPEATARALGNDIPNAELVLQSSRVADVVLENTG
jgi:pantothenate kinase